MSEHDFEATPYASQLEAVDDEIARLASACGIRLLDEGVITEVISGNADVCASPNARAFHELRGLLEMHYELTNDSIDRLGAQKAAEVLEQIRARLKDRFDLGGTPGGVNPADP